MMLLPKLFKCLRALLTISLALLTMSVAPECRAAQSASAGATSNPAAPSRYLMAHYMPWFQSKQYSGSWGWHWTMNHYDPDHVVNGRRDAPSRYYPAIGLYDSGDPDALQCHALLMKIAGIHGVIFDWYGPDEYTDYGVNNRNTEKMIPYLQAAGLKFAVCYETHTVVTETAANVFPVSDAVGHGQRVLQWLQQQFFSKPNYLKIKGRPVFLAFGDPYYNDAQWNQIFSVLAVKPLFYTEANRQEATAAAGAFDWPQPAGGTRGALTEVDRFYSQIPRWPSAIPAAYPRFDDIYSQAGVSKSWGHIDDQDGQTYVSLLTRALQSNTPVVQLVTWNDWGEGTQIEPSVEYGYRDLEATQRLRLKYLDTSSQYTAADLRLPVAWYRLRKQYSNDPVRNRKLARVPSLIVADRMNAARTVLAQVQK